MKLQHMLLALLRISLGWVFFWGFIDKLFGLQFTTASEAAWLAGGSPTAGFLKFATKGPFAEFYQGLAGNAFVDWLFMLGLLLVGASLLLGIFNKLAAWSGALMMVLMYTAGFIPPEHNPIVDEHWVYALLLLLLAYSRAGDYWGFGQRWSRSSFVKRFPFFG